MEKVYLKSKCPPDMYLMIQIGVRSAETREIANDADLFHFCSYPILSMSTSDYAQ